MVLAECKSAPELRQDDGETKESTRDKSEALPITSHAKDDFHDASNGDNIRNRLAHPAKKRRT
eukprot:CAMPEP_0113530518 /NCGR_PEP_ID=MMETSP0015_2-20120614/2983_1 /TAXON_ID=2838 /ORGANISM="Odontella" /LENGTH=62 /DNA_ID=CAMNT_0000429247 /DNA_START=1572 /DNA_END=1760 /DNA_ORIENTATION=- /assembly_acc=CAM_ASM_000160